MKQQEELERLDRFTRIVENSGWRPLRNERPPVLTPEDEVVTAYENPTKSKEIG